MPGFHGADVQQLRALAQTMHRSGERLGQLQREMSQLVDGTLWRGHDAAAFRSDWSTSHRAVLAAAAAQLLSNAKTLAAQADEQDQASGGAGTGFRGKADGDKPGSPDKGKLGNYKPLPDTVPLDDKALDPTNMRQGQIGDCWLLAALGSVAKNDPQFIRDHMWENPDGTWTVKMYKDGEPVYIQVEPEVVEKGAKDSSGKDNWLSIYEKAAAEYYGGEYDDIDGGYSSDAFEAITGSKADSSGELNLDDIQDRLKDGPVALGTEGDPSWWPLDDETDDNRIVPNHAYIVDKVESRDGQKMIHVLNPWGPSGGSYDGHDRAGDLWLTEEQYKENFDSVYSVPSTRK